MVTRLGRRNSFKLGLYEVKKIETQGFSEQLLSCGLFTEDSQRYYVVEGELLNPDEIVKSTNLVKGVQSKENTIYRGEEITVHTKIGKIDRDGAVTASGKVCRMEQDSSAREISVTFPKNIKQERISQIICARKSNGTQVHKDKKEEKLPLKYDINITAGRGSDASIVLCNHTLDNDSYATKGIIKIKVEEGATLNLLSVQNENKVSTHETFIRIDIERSARLRFNIINLRGGDVYNYIKTVLSGEGGECILSGLYFTSDSQHLTTKVNLLHEAPGCKSNQLFKGILEDDSLSDFEGEIIVTPVAQKTEAYQANNNLLASERARASAQPHLIIYADDVKCSHGATIGAIGDEEIFYMRSRGISLQEARILQKEAFAGAVLERISDPDIRERLINLVGRRLRGEDIGCVGCRHACKK